MHDPINGNKYVNRKISSTVTNCKSSSIDSQFSVDIALCSSGQQAGRFLPLSLYGRLLCPLRKFLRNY